MESTGNEELDELIEVAGYSYDPKQDIFISRMHPWQRKIGYCSFYDVSAPLMGMIFDSEPIHFTYNNKKWMIGLWKGQYDMVTGGEIGVYKNIINIPGISSGIYYRCANDDELLPTSFTLKKNGQTLFTRKGKHWWLTGFKLGEFSQPSELTMDNSITLTNAEMRDAFISGLKDAGYSDSDLTVNGNTVSFIFNVPHTPQPFTRTQVTDQIIQKKNKFLCDEFQALTGSHNTIPEKIAALEELSPSIYRRIISVGTSSTLAWIIAIVIFIILLSILSRIIEPKRDPIPLLQFPRRNPIPLLQFNDSQNNNIYILQFDESDNNRIRLLQFDDENN